MIRIKTLSLPLISALVASATLPASGQVALTLSSQKEYRQNKHGINFTGGNFDISVTDGSVASVAGCNWIKYYPPGIFLGVCSEGTTAFLTSGALGGATINFPYLLVTSIIPAIIIEPRKPELVRLNAAPASDLPRPSGGFVDDSSSLFYNLHTDNATEYILTRYQKSMGYTASQGDRFENEIIPGVYHYSFPRLKNPTQPAPITAVIYPILEGEHTKNNKTEGFVFTQVGANKWNEQGFLEFSYHRPNLVQWSPISPAVIFPAVDDMYISLRRMSNPSSPKSDILTRTASIFPPYLIEGGNPRVKLANPFVNTFTFPPIFHSGTKSIMEVELQRSFQTGGVTYDFSNRKFQVPIVVVDRYTEFSDIVFSRKKTDILADPDKDGYNNLTEWILDSNPSESFSIPTAPVPDTLPGIIYPFFGPIGTIEFGFTIDKKLGTIPRVTYTLQRSRDNGQTWKRFVSDGNWSVENVRYTLDGSRRSEIHVRSLVESNPRTDPATFVQPPGTENDIYRVKVVLAK